jgi:hypothetical protein
MTSDEFHSLANKKNIQENSFLDFDFDISYGELIADKIHNHINNSRPNIRIRDTKSYLALKYLIRKYIKKIIISLTPEAFSKIIFRFVRKK